MWLIKKITLFFITAPGLFFIILFANVFVFSLSKFTHRFKKRFLFFSFLLTYIATTSLITKPILHKLEGDCSFNAGSLRNIDAITVLTAGTDTDTTIRRLVATAAIYTEIKKPIIILGGITKKGMPAESVSAATMLVAMGLPRTEITTENNSINTYENIIELEKIASTKKINNIALVSSASHIPRIKMLLSKTKLNIIIIPSACTASSKFSYEELIPSINNMEINLTLMYEILGNIKYAIFY